MERIDLFYQCEGSGEIGQVEVDPDATFATVKAELVDRHSLDEDVSLFLEDEDEPLDENSQVSDVTDPTSIIVHLNRCRRVLVSVTFNGRTVEDEFGPSATIARVKHWAAESEFGMSPEDAGEHFLQIVGTHDRLVPGTHIGRLVNCPTCSLAFDLVPDDRVNGSPRSRT